MNVSLLPKYNMLGEKRTFCNCEVFVHLTLRHCESNTRVPKEKLQLYNILLFYFLVFQLNNCHIFSLQIKLQFN